MKNKGITLISLIITIIVLLILAGVTINMVLGENGLFNKAKTSVAKYENAQEKENTALAGYENEINNASRETVTISKEEYDILKNNNTYSINETKIGTWEDGRPIYRQRVKLPDQTSNNQRVTLDLTTIIPDIDQVVLMPFGYATYNNDDSMRITLPTFNFASGSNASSAGFKTRNKVIEFSDFDWSFAFINIYAYISYTKTSDTATNNL